MVGSYMGTEDKNQAEERRLRYEQRLRLLAEQSPLGFLEWDENFYAVEWNAACERIFGYSREEAIGRHAKDLILPPNVHELVDGIYQSLMRQTGGAHSINENNTKDGRVIICEWYNTTLVDRNGKAIGVASICNDITERIRMEEELHQYKEHLEETVQKRTSELELARNAAEAANKAKSIFLANMSHELRTPLNAILGFSRIMSRDKQLSKKHLENLVIINRSGEHLLKLINDVLEMARIEAGKLQLDIATYDLEAAVRDVMELMHFKSNEKELTLTLERSSDVPRYVKGDESRLRQILINLLNNALKYTDEGSITLRMKIGGDDNKLLIMEVGDTGRGIDKKDLERLFEPFEQLSDHMTSYGTGLGLTIARQFVEMMGGSISVKSVLGEGSIFRVELPIEVVNDKETFKDEVTKPGEVVGFEPYKRGFRILIAEDQRDDRLLLETLMKDIGLEVKTVADGKQCVELFRKWQPDIIWMDRRMPVMDGVEAVIEIRKLPTGKKVKIIAVTASAFKEQQAEILNAGMDGFIRKPYRFEEIYEYLAKYLGLKYFYDKTPFRNEPAILRVEMLRAIPQDFLAELKASLESLEIDRIQKSISKIGSIDVKLAQVLTELADNFRYPEILSAITSVKTE